VAVQVAKSDAQDLLGGGVRLDDTPLGIEDNNTARERVVHAA